MKCTPFPNAVVLNIYSTEWHHLLHFNGYKLEGNIFTKDEVSIKVNQYTEKSLLLFLEITYHGEKKIAYIDYGPSAIHYLNWIHKNISEQWHHLPIPFKIRINRENAYKEDKANNKKFLRELQKLFFKNGFITTTGEEVFYNKSKGKIYGTANFFNCIRILSLTTGKCIDLFPSCKMSLRSLREEVGK